MKRTLVYSLGLLFLSATAVFQSCGPTETSEPILVVTSFSDGWDAASQTFTGEVGDTLELEISVEAEGVFNTARISHSDGSTLSEETRSEDGQTSYKSTYQYILKDEEAGDTSTLTIAGIDEEARSVEEKVTIITLKKAVPVVKYTAKLLYAPLADDLSKTFLSTDDGETYSKDDVEGTADPVSPKIDFGYYYGGTDKASIASPAAYPSDVYDLSAWGTRNETLLKLTAMPVDHFTSIEDNDDIAHHWGMTDMTDADGDVIDLAVDNLVAFQLDKEKGGKRGFFIVKEISGTFNSGDYIEIEVVIEGEE